MERGPRGEPPPILTLLRYADEHRTALACDLRQAFGLSIDDMGEGFSWGEAWELVQGLAMEPGTRMHAALVGWEWPLSRADQVAMLLVDIQGRQKIKGWKPLPRPWDRTRIGKVRGLSQGQVIARLQALGPQN